MEKVRIGNDIQVKYTVLRDGLPESFAGATNIVVEVRNEAYGKIIPSTFSIVDNVVNVVLDAKDCVLCGKHRVTLSYNRGNDITIDALAFELVQFTSQTGGTDIVGVEIVTVNISGDIGIAIPDNNKIDLDGLNSNIDKLHFKPDTLVQLAEIGDVRYSPESKTLEVKVSDTVSIQLGQEMQTRVKNDAGVQIDNGQLVYINSAAGDNPLAKIASTTDANIAQRTFGMATENIAFNGFGAITTEGLVRDVNTAAFTEGDMLWLGINGAVTNIEPVAPTPKISVGMVLRSNVANGVIYVKIRAISRNQKLSDVYAPTLTGGDILRWNSTTLRFETFNVTTALAGKADLVGGKIPTSQLPAYVDDVLEYANLAAFPATGETGKIYVALDTNLTYRWSGTAYVEISKSLALGETSSTAYRGDRGKTAYDHSQATGNPHSTTAAQIPNTPAGTVAATTVQGAINELAGDIVQVETDLNNVLVPNVHINASNEIRKCVKKICVYNLDEIDNFYINRLWYVSNTEYHVEIKGIKNDTIYSFFENVYINNINETEVDYTLTSSNIKSFIHITIDWTKCTNIFYAATLWGYNESGIASTNIITTSYIDYLKNKLDISSLSYLDMSKKLIGALFNENEMFSIINELYLINGFDKNKKYFIREIYIDSTDIVITFKLYTNYSNVLVLRIKNKGDGLYRYISQDRAFYLYMYLNITNLIAIGGAITNTDANKYIINNNVAFAQTHNFNIENELLKINPINNVLVDSSIPELYHINKMLLDFEITNYEQYIQFYFLRVYCSIDNYYIFTIKAIDEFGYATEFEYNTTKLDLMPVDFKNHSIVLTAPGKKTTVRAVVNWEYCENYLIPGVTTDYSISGISNSYINPKKYIESLQRIYGYSTVQMPYVNSGNVIGLNELCVIGDGVPIDIKNFIQNNYLIGSYIESSDDALINEFLDSFIGDNTIYTVRFLGLIYTKKGLHKNPNLNFYGYGSTLKMVDNSGLDYESCIKCTNGGIQPNISLDIDHLNTYIKGFELDGNMNNNLTYNSLYGSGIVGEIYNSQISPYAGTQFAINVYIEDVYAHDFNRNAIVANSGWKGRNIRIKNSKDDHGLYCVGGSDISFENITFSGSFKNHALCISDSNKLYAIHKCDNFYFKNIIMDGVISGGMIDIRGKFENVNYPVNNVVIDGFTVKNNCALTSHMVHIGLPYDPIPLNVNTLNKNIEIRNIYVDGINDEGYSLFRIGGCNVKLSGNIIVNRTLINWPLIYIPAFSGNILLNQYDFSKLNIILLNSLPNNKSIIFGFVSKGSSQNINGFNINGLSINSEQDDYYLFGIRGYDSVRQLFIYNCDMSNVCSKCTDLVNNAEIIKFETKEILGKIAGTL